MSKRDARDALNRTATYHPTARFPAQRGWGHVDANTVDAAVRA